MLEPVYKKGSYSMVSSKSFESRVDGDCGANTNNTLKHRDSIQPIARRRISFVTSDLLLPSYFFSLSAPHSEIAKYIKACRLFMHIKQAGIYG